MPSLPGILNTCIVDELAHTNVPGSKNRKRYEDVLELLDAGINVMTAVNVQHLETLNDSVSRSADTQIRETIPDSFLKRADEVVNVDVTVEELRSRLKQGKIYAAEKIEQSLANFFRKGNLSMLRELALRTTAEEVGSRAAEYRRSQGLEQAPIPEKVMVCLSPRPGAERLLRVGARIAGRLATNWYAVRVESPDEDARHGDPEEYQRMEEYQRLARELGAQVVVLKDKNVADALIEFAQQESISHVVFGQSARSRFDILLRGLGDQPVSGGDSRCHGAGGSHQQGQALDFARPVSSAVPVRQARRLDYSSKAPWGIRWSVLDRCLTAFRGAVAVESDCADRQPPARGANHSLGCCSCRASAATASNSLAKGFKRFP